MIHRRIVVRSGKKFGNRLWSVAANELKVSRVSAQRPGGPKTDVVVSDVITVPAAVAPVASGVVIRPSHLKVAKLKRQ